MKKLLKHTLIIGLFTTSVMSCTDREIVPVEPAEVSVLRPDDRSVEVHIPMQKVDEILMEQAGTTDLTFAEKRKIMSHYIHAELLQMNVLDAAQGVSSGRTEGISIEGGVAAEIGLYHGGGWSTYLDLGTHLETVQKTKQYETDFSPTILGAYSELYAENSPGTGYFLIYSKEVAPKTINCPYDAAKTKATSRFRPRSDGQLTITNAFSTPTNIYLYAYVKCD